MFAAGTALESDEAVFQWQDLHECIDGHFN